MIDALIQLIYDAGKVAMEIYQRDFDIYTKSDQSPVTEADLAVNALLCKGLKEINSQIPILSEENQSIPYVKRKEWVRYWLLDPIDGTKEFIKKNGEFSINVALIEEGIPTLGFVYAPALDLFYYGGTYTGEAFKIEAGVKTSMQPPTRPSQELATVSRSHLDAKTKEYLDLRFGENMPTRPLGSSLKICAIAEGKATVYPKLGPTMEWDTASAHAILRLLGGECLRLEKDFSTAGELVYNKENLYNPWFVVQLPD